ncbi:Mitochondrial distribution and morphology protein 10, partial [Dipsacomyces acuminosporus]
MVFTAPDYFPLLTRQFHKETQWDESNSYSSFCRTSQAILDFAIPYGVSVSTGRGISNSLYSQLAFSMIPSRASSVGYLATSRTLPILQQSSSSQVIAAGAANTTDQLRLVSSAMPGSKGDIALASNNGAETGTEAVLTGFQPSPKQPLSNSETTSHPSLLFSSASAPGFSQCCTFEAIRQQALDQQSSQDLLQNIRAGIWKCNWGASGKKPSSKAPCGDEDSYVGDYLLVAQMYPSVASVTGSYISRRSKSSEIVVSGVSVAGPQPDLQLVLQHAINHRRWSTEATFGTSGKLIGLRGQYNFGDISSLDSAAYAFYNGSNEDAKQVLRQKPHGRFSVGSEVYYGIQDSSGGISI